MKIIDKQGRLFGKISVIDLIVIAVENGVNDRVYP